MIRAYTPADLDSIVDIGDRAWRDIYRMFRQTYGNALFSAIVPDATISKGEQIRAHCQRHSEWVFICEEASCIVGFITFRLDLTTKIGTIGNNAVDPDCGLKGIGQQMYQAVLQHCKEQGMRFAKVQTGLDDAHAPARRAYERAGFDIRHEDVTYFKKL